MTHQTHPKTIATEFCKRPSKLIRDQKTRRNQESATRLIEGLLERNSRHLTLVLMLGYNSAFRPEATFDDLRRDRDRFLNSIRFKSELNAINGYIWKAEEGGGKGGLHLHMVIIYDGGEREGISFARAIGEYWNNTITQGRGRYRNGNFDAANAEPGSLPWGDVTGPLNRADTDKQARLLGYIGDYICKPNQRVKFRTKHERTFGTSRLPKDKAGDSDTAQVNF